MGKSAVSQATITGLQAFRGEGAPPPRGFWADAWDHVLKQPTALVGLGWVGVVLFFAIYGPIISSGHPLVMWEIDRRTGDDAARWVRQELAGGRDATIVREGATYATARAALERELGRHSGAPAATEFLPEPSEGTADDRPLTISEVLRLESALAASAPLDATGDELRPTSPLLEHLTAADWAILLGGTAGIVLIAIPSRWMPGFPRSRRFGRVALIGVQAVATIVVAAVVRTFFMGRDAPEWAREAYRWDLFVPVAAGACAAVIALVMMALPVARLSSRLLTFVPAAAVVALIVGATWRSSPGSFEYLDRERVGEIRAVYTLVPWSSNQRPSDRDASALPPGTTHDQALANVLRSALPVPGGMRPSTAADVDEAIRLARELPVASEVRDRLADHIQERFGGQDGVTPAQVRAAAHEQLRGVGKAHVLGTDKFGQDVLAQILHACRLAISMGIVATGLATLIGVTMGALMGYFGGWVDLALYRVVEMFMAIPVLFLLIVAAGVTPPEYRSTYVLMAIIGCITWHGAARFTRAEFMKLRSQDFVQSARSVGLPLRSILFKHMLPNGVTPVLVDASFGIAAAILFEATLSYLGLGPPDQPSWGRVLADAAGEAGTFNWWLGVFPGLAIFLTVLSLTMVGEALRDAIDPKLKKARV